MNPLSIQTSFGREIGPSWLIWPCWHGHPRLTLAGGIFQSSVPWSPRVHPARSNNCRRSHCSPREKTRFSSFYLCPSARNGELCVCSAVLKCGRKASGDLSGFQGRHVIFLLFGRKNRLLPCESVVGFCSRNYSLLSARSLDLAGGQEEGRGVPFLDLKWTIWHYSFSKRTILRVRQTWILFCFGAHSTHSHGSLAFVIELRKLSILQDDYS